MRIQNLLRSIFAMSFCLVLTTAVSAQDNDAILEVTIADEKHSFTLADLRSMPATGFETTTIWTEGPQMFEGVSLEYLLEALSVSEGTIVATAINDYSVEIPLGDAVASGPIIAYHNNGEEMSRRDKGPLWIVYPYDSKREYQTETIYSRSIWQLDRIKIE